MTIKVEDLTDVQRWRLQQIRKEYRDRGLNYTLNETLAIVLRTHLKAYINQELEDALESLCPTVKGRMEGRDWEVDHE